MSGIAAHRLVIVVRADPVICGHSVEARNLAEAALGQGFTEVRIITWPIDRLISAGLPMKPLDSVLPYSPGIVVERPEPVGDHRVPDGRYLAGLTGRLVELFTDGVRTVALSLYLSPHALAVAEARRIALGTGLSVPVTTMAEAVGSDITNIVRSSVEHGRLGVAAHVLGAYLDHDSCFAVSEFTRELIITAAEQVDARLGTRYAERCRQRIEVSYPAIDVSSYLELDPVATEAALARRGLRPGGYALFLSRLSRAKGVEDLIDGFAVSRARADLDLVIAGTGPDAALFRAWAAESGVGHKIIFLDDVGDADKPGLLAGAAAFVLPSKPRPDFVETFGIALVEKMLAGGGPVITTATGGIGEAVGDTAMIVPAGDPRAIADALDRVVYELTDREHRERELRARAHAVQFDRAIVLERLLSRTRVPDGLRLARLGL